jgi:hypothetical protein
MSEPFDASPYSEKEIWEAFHRSASISKHLLIIYSLCVGLGAKRIVDLGVGSTTKALRLAAKETGGLVLSCDCDAGRFSHLLECQDENWKLFLGPSETFLRGLEPRLDLVVHDAAHDYFQVKLDIELILPKMNAFGLVCIHDTQHPELASDMLQAIKDASNGMRISMTNLPFCHGLAVLRLEDAGGSYLATYGSGPGDRAVGTGRVSCPMCFDGERDRRANRSIRRWLRWRLRKLVKGY